MSVLQKLQEAGLSKELESHMSTFFSKDDTASRGKLLETIDKNGLKSPVVMKMIGHLQTAKILTPGLYEKLTNLSKQLKAAPTNGESKKEEEVMTEAPTGEVTEPEEVEGTSSILSSKQEQMVADRLKKAEERMRKRLLDQEVKLREKFAGRAQKKAQRLGMKVEEAKEIQDLKAHINDLRAQVKVQREEMKACHAKIKELRPARPKREKKEKKEKE